MKSIGVCLAGYGNFGKKLFSYLELRSSQFKTIAIYHPDHEKALGTEQMMGSSDLDYLLTHPKIDTFIISTPNDQHFDLLVRVLKTGRHHIFVEKPMTQSLGDAEALKSYAHKNSKVFMVGHNQRREAVYRKAKELIDLNAIGKVVSVNFNLSHGGAFTIDPENWRASSTRNPLGPLAMVGSHCIDTIHYLFGSVSAVCAKLSNLTNQTASPDSSSVMMWMASGASVMLQNDYNVPSEKHCFIYGTEGVIYISRGKIWIRRGRDSQDGNRFTPAEKEEISVRKTDPIEEELQEFAAAIQKNKGIETGYWEGLKVMEVLEACKRSVLKNSIESPH